MTLHRSSATATVAQATVAQETGAANRRRLILSAIESKLAAAAEIKIRPSASFDETLDAFRLVYGEYVTTGYEPPHAAGLRVTEHHLLPGTQVLVAYGPASDGAAAPMIGTATLVLDSALGLPLETLCGPCVAAMRRQGARIGEIISLAVLPEWKGSAVLAALLFGCLHLARREGLDTLVSTYARHHADFFRLALGAEPFGPAASYDHGHGVIAQCHRVHLSALPTRFKQFDVTDQGWGEGFRMDQDCIERLLRSHRTLAASLTDEQRAHIETAFREADHTRTSILHQ